MQHALARRNLLRENEMPVYYMDAVVEGSLIRFEISPNQVSGELPVSPLGGRIKSLGEISDEVVQQMKTLGQLMMKSKNALIETPDEMEVEFGLNIEGSSGIIISSGTIGAHLKVSFKWTK